MLTGGTQQAYLSLWFTTARLTVFITSLLVILIGDGHSAGVEIAHPRLLPPPPLWDSFSTTDQSKTVKHFLPNPYNKSLSSCRNLPAKSPAEEQRHQQLHRQMMAAARKKELQNAKEEVKKEKMRRERDKVVADSLKEWEKIIPKWDKVWVTVLLTISAWVTVLEVHVAVHHNTVCCEFSGAILGRFKSFGGKVYLQVCEGLYGKKPLEMIWTSRQVRRLLLLIMWSGCNSWSDHHRSLCDQSAAM